MDDEIFLDCLQLNLASDKTTHDAVSDTLAGFKSSKSGFSRMFIDVDRRMQLGDSVRSSLRHGIKTLGLKDKELESKLMRLSECGDERAAIEGICDELSYRRRLDLELGFGSLQKYLTLSLLVSVILPSLSLFGFIGYSMLYDSSIALAAFSALLVSLFPMLFALIQKRISEIYE